MSCDCPCGGSNWDHRRLIEATQQAGALRREVEILREQIEVMAEAPSDIPLWRRIATQRRELKALNFWASRWYAMSRELAQLRREKGSIQ